MKDQKEVKINKMEIQLTDEKISLTMPEAKKLYEALAELFGKKTVEHIHHNDYWYRPYRWYDSAFYLTAKSSLGDNAILASQNLQDYNAKLVAENGVNFSAKGSTLMCDLTK